jgi:gluconokinase
MKQEPIHPIVVMGVSGSGKSTIGRALALRLNARFIEGDDFHPPANIAKMSHGMPLTDEDRWPWLEALRQELSGAVYRGETVVLSCSALRQVYRDRLGLGLPGLTWIYLKGDREALLRNFAKRSDHFMKANMLDSQLRTLEEPVDAIVLPCEGPVDELVDHAVRRLHET